MQTTDDIMSLIVEQPENEAPAETETPEVEEEATETQEVESEAAADEEADDSVKDAEQDDDQNADEAEADEQPVFTVKVDGEDREVTLDELTRSFAGQGYIQKRMQENAAKAKEVEAVYNSFIQERAQLAHLIEQVQSGQLITAPKEPDANLLKSDPVKYHHEFAQYQQKKAAYDQQQAQIEQYTAQQSATQQRALAAYQAEQMRELAARLPEIADPEKGAVLVRQLASTAENYGYAPEEIGQVSDHRALLILNDAMKWRQLQEQRDKAAKKVENARPISKPKAQKAADSSAKKKADAIRKRMRESGNVDDVAQFLIT